MINQVLYYLDNNNNSPAYVIYMYDLESEKSEVKNIKFDNKGGYDTSLYYDEETKSMFTQNKDNIYRYTVKKI